MTRGRPRNLERIAARALGELTYVGPVCICGCAIFYASNAACVDCTKARASRRYADPRTHNDIVAKDAARYAAKKASE